MNLYGCVPASYFPSPSLTYWAHAASLAGLPVTESALTSASIALGLKKSQLPLSLCDVIQKSRSAASLRSSEDIPSSFHVTSRASAHSSDAGVALALHGHSQIHARLQLQQQQQRHQHQSHHHLQHRPFSTTPPPIGNGLAPLQALCDSDVSTFTGKSSGSSSSTSDSKGSLKFGMSRILSDDFGKSKNEKENSFQLSSVPESCRSLPLCPCNSPACTAYARPPSPYPRGAIPALSAVHALQPPNYPHSSSADALPGPYSILSTESGSGGQPKRKRSWSRAVFSNLQRKGLEKRFEVQKYVTKPDRRQLAAMLGLTDAQVKVWFQNRRMKWRHAQQQGEKDKQIQQSDEQAGNQPAKQDSKNSDVKGPEKSTLPGSNAKFDDVKARASGSHDSDKHEPSCEVMDMRSDHTEDSRTGSPTVNRRLPSGSSSPIDAHNRLFTRAATPERCISLAVSFDTRNEVTAEIAHCHDGKDILRYDSMKNRVRDVISSPLHDRASSPGMGGHHGNQSFRDVTGEPRLDSDEGSRSGLEIDSDVDVNDDDDFNDENTMEDLSHLKYGKERDRKDSGHFDDEEDEDDDDVSMKEIDVDN